MSPPKKGIIKIIDVDAETSGEVITEKNNIERMMNKLKSKSNENIKIWDTTNFSSNSNLHQN